MISHDPKEKIAQSLQELNNLLQSWRKSLLFLIEQRSFFARRSTLFCGIKALNSKKSGESAEWATSVHRIKRVSLLPLT